MKERSAEETSELIAILEMVPDPRHKRGIRYKLCDLLLTLIYAALCGYSEGSDVAYTEETMPGSKG